jgi:hypothetical protein
MIYGSLSVCFGPQPLRHTAQVLRGGGQQKLITGAVVAH